MDGCETDVRDVGFETSLIQLHWEVRSDFTLSRPTPGLRLRSLRVDWNRPLVRIAWKSLAYVRGEKKWRDILPKR